MGWVCGGLVAEATNPDLLCIQVWRNLQQRCEKPALVPSYLIFFKFAISGDIFVDGKFGFEHVHSQWLTATNCASSRPSSVIDSCQLCEFTCLWCSTGWWRFQDCLPVSLGEITNIVLVQMTVERKWFHCHQSKNVGTIQICKREELLLAGTIQRKVRGHLNTKRIHDPNARYRRVARNCYGTTNRNRRLRQVNCSIKRAMSFNCKSVRSAISL